MSIAKCFVENEITQVIIVSERLDSSWDTFSKWHDSSQYWNDSTWLI